MSPPPLVNPRFTSFTSNLDAPYIGLHVCVHIGHISQGFSVSLCGTIYGTDLETVVVFLCGFLEWFFRSIDPRWLPINVGATLQAHRILGYGLGKTWKLYVQRLYHRGC